MSKRGDLIQYIKHSGFVRSVFIRVLAIFIIVSIAVTSIAFVSFTSEVRKNILSERLRQLNIIENTVSKRMAEITSIAYGIGFDSAFYLESVENDRYSGYEMSNMLARYVAGNSYVEYLAYYRLSEPDKVYVSTGERSLTEFFGTSFGLDKATAEETVKAIQSQTKTQIIPISYGNDKYAFFSYLYPLPQLSAKPQAYVLMLIPIKEVTPLCDTLLAGSNGEVAVLTSTEKKYTK